MNGSNSVQSQRTQFASKHSRHKTSSFDRSQRLPGTSGASGPCFEREGLERTSVDHRIAAGRKRIAGEKENVGQAGPKRSKMSLSRQNTTTATERNVRRASTLLDHFSSGSRRESVPAPKSSSQHPPGASIPPRITGSTTNLQPTKTMPLRLNVKVSEHMLRIPCDMEEADLTVRWLLDVTTSRYGKMFGPTPTISHLQTLDGAILDPLDQLRHVITSEEVVRAVVSDWGRQSANVLYETLCAKQDIDLDTRIVTGISQLSDEAKFELEGADFTSRPGSVCIDVLSHLSDLTSITLRNSRLDLQSSSLLETALYRLPSLTALDLSASQLSSTTAANLLRSLRTSCSLVELNLAYNDLSGKDFPDALQEYVHNRGECMRTLKMDYCFLSQRFVASFFASCSTYRRLGTLTLAGNLFTTNSLRQLAKAVIELPGPLHTLDLSHIRDSGDDWVAPILTSPISTLCLTGTNCGVTLSPVLASVDLVSLYAAGTGLNSLQFKPGCLRNVIELDLSFNTIGPHGAQALATAIPLTPRLTHLNLANCGFGKSGFLAILTAIGRHDLLQKLDLSTNVGDDSWSNSDELRSTSECIGQVIRSPCLVHLDLSSNFLPKTLVRVVRDMWYEKNGGADNMRTTQIHDHLLLRA